MTEKPMRVVMIPVSYGEAADRVTILRIKNERIRDPVKLDHVRQELALATDSFFAQAVLAPGFDALFAELKSVNESLWEVEDALRHREAKGDFGAGFVELARQVYRTNDRRAEIKRAIDELLGSDLREEKSYAT